MAPGCSVGLQWRAMRGWCGDCSPTSSRASAGCCQLGTDSACRAAGSHPSARGDPATARADSRAGSAAVPKLPQLRSSPLVRFPVCATDRPLWRASETWRQPGHPGHCQAWLAPTEVIEVTPEACACGQREFPEAQPYHTYQVIELPEIQMVVKHLVVHETRCPRCGRLLKAERPAKYRYGYGPRLTALIGELSGSQRNSRSAVQEFCRSVLGGASVVARFNAPSIGSWRPSPHITRRLRSRPGVRRSTILTRPPGISTGCWGGCR